MSDGAAIPGNLYEPVIEAFRNLLASGAAEPRRVFHGRGHLHPGLEHINVDWYPPVLLVSGYEPIEDVVALAEALKAQDADNRVACITYQLRSSRGATSEHLLGEPVQQVVNEEHGVRYEVAPGLHQNAGLFLDMRPLRGWLLERSRDRNVLNLFAYTCSLSVAALQGGARQVVSVDMSKPAIQWGIRNHELNGHDLRKVKSLPHNLFKSWGRIAQYGRYDCILIDPPTRQRGSFDAEKDYAAVLKKLHKLVAPGADVIATVNSPYLGRDFLPNLVQRHQSKFRLVGEMPASPEFADAYPDRALKIYHFRAPG